MLPALGGRISPVKSASTNPFDNESLGDEPLSPADPCPESELTDSVTDMSGSGEPIKYKMRGGLISGNVIDAEEEVRKKDDVESGSWPPDSDYASRAPKSIWEAGSLAFSGDAKAENIAQPQVAERQTQSRVSNNSSNYNNRFGGPTKRRKYLRILLGVTGVVLLLALVTVIFIVRSNNKDKSLVVKDPRQLALDAIVKTASTPEALSDENSPQQKARRWLLLEDELAIDPRDEKTSEAQVIQRYSLAVLYFSTGGPITWEENNWLEGGECDGTYWSFIDCNENKEVHAMVFGKALSVATFHVA